MKNTLLFLAIVWMAFLHHCAPVSAQALFTDDFSGITHPGAPSTNRYVDDTAKWSIDPRTQQYQGRTLFAYDPNNPDNLADQPNIITQNSDTFVRLYAESYYPYTVTVKGVTYSPGQACRGDQIRTQGFFAPPTSTQGVEVEARLRCFAPGGDTNPSGVVNTLYFFGRTDIRPGDARAPALPPANGAQRWADEVDYENFGKAPYTNTTIGATTFNRR